MLAKLYATFALDGISQANKTPAKIFLNSEN